MIFFFLFILSEVEQKFIVQDTLKYYKLPHHIIKQSEKIKINEKILSTQDYSIDYEEGIVYFNIPIKKGDTIYLSYKKLPFDLDKNYSRKDKTKNKTQSSLSINVEGEKKFSLGLSNSGVIFDQAMLINLNGKITDGVEISGILKDNDTPLQESGVTQEIKEMDEMYIKINSKKGEAKLGNFKINMDNEFGKITREVDGVILKNENITMGKAIYPGEWKIYEFTGKTGKQGPYELSKNGIVKNSEFVYVNNKRVKDYNIDYEAGTITFNTKLFIKDGDIIRVEFQEITEDYKKEVSIINAKKECFHIGFFQEKNKLRKNDFFIAGYKKEFNNLKLTIEGARTQGKAIKGGIIYEKSILQTQINFNKAEKKFFFPGIKKDTTPQNAYSIYTIIKPKNWIKTKAGITKLEKEKRKTIGLSIHNFSYNYWTNNKEEENIFYCDYNIRAYTPFIEYKIGNNKKESKIGIKNKDITIQLNRAPYIYGGSIFINKENLAFNYTGQKSGKNYIDLGEVRVKNKNFNLAYNLTSVELYQYKEEYYKVEKGKGSYSKDSLTGNYYPNPRGEYQKRIIKSNEPSIYKNFSLLNEIKIPIPIISGNIRIGTKKEGEAKNISIWKRRNDAISDKNVLKFGINVENLAIYYIKEDRRENKILQKFEEANKEIFRLNIKQFSYEINQLKKYANHQPVWEEKTNSIGINNNIGENFNIHTKLEHKTIEDFIYQTSNVYGIHMASDYKIKNINIFINLIYWYHQNLESPIVKSVYPGGLSKDWSITFSFPYNNKTTYYLYYQGSHYPSYPLQHSIKTEIKINF